MYAIDLIDKVVALTDVPKHSAGAPMPLVIANDGNVVLIFESAPTGDELVILRFARVRAHYFGSPNDEALKGHPLKPRGLEPYGVFEVIGSSWIRSLERMNQMCLGQISFDRYRHFIFTFHDNTFECIAEDVITVARLPNDADVTENLLHRAVAYLR